MSFAVPAYGSVIVVEILEHRIIVAGDSMRISDDGSPINDHACKITELAPTAFFFATGKTGINGVWSATELSKRAFLGSKDIRDSYTLVRIAANWAALMEEKYREDISRFVSNPSEANLCQGVFAEVAGEGSSVVRQAE